MNLATDQRAIKRFLVVAWLVLVAGCGSTLDQNAELVRLKQLVPTLPASTKVIAKKGTVQDAGELWLTTSSDPLAPPTPAKPLARRPYGQEVPTDRIAASTVLALADQLQVELPNLGNPADKDAYLHESQIGDQKIRIRDLKMDNGWLSTIERLPGELSN